MTLDDSLQAELDAIAAAAPGRERRDRRALAAPGRPDRARPPRAGVRLAPPTALAGDRRVPDRRSPPTEPDLPDGPSYASLERRLSRWVDSGLGELKETPWLLGLHLDERPGSDALALELWLHAADDPTLSLPASLLWQGGEGFAFVRDGDPYGDLDRAARGARAAARRGRDRVRRRRAERGRARHRATRRSSSST